MRKTILYLVLLVVLGGGVWYFLFSDKNVFGVDEAGFNVADTGDIYKIFMADRNGRTITLKREENGWIVNDSFPAMKAPLNTLLSTMNRQLPTHPVSERMHNIIIKSMSAKAVKVELYDKRGKKTKVFYVGGQAGSTEGTFMLMEGAQKPYVVQIPGFEGYLTSRYSTDLQDWRDRSIFDIKPDELKSVTIKYPDYPLNNFTLTRSKDGELRVDADPIIMQQPFNKRRAEVYTKFFENINSEGYVNGVYRLDSAIAYAPKRLTIDVETQQGEKEHVEIHWMPVNKRSKNQTAPDPNIPNEYDADRYYAIINDFKDTVIIQRYTFDKIFRKAYEFYSPDEEAKPEADTIFSNTVRMPRQQ